MLEVHQTITMKRGFPTRVYYLFLMLCSVIVICNFALYKLLNGSNNFYQKILNQRVLDYVAETNDQQETSAGNQEDRCALNFFGLPRAFESMVLPSIVKNIIPFNHGCDYYVHYYDKNEEAPGRAGAGGVIDAKAVMLLRDAVHEHAMRQGIAVLPIVGFTLDTEEDFWRKYSDLLETIRTTKVDGKYLYFPWGEKNYRYPESTDNIVKMWHSIQSSYKLMESVAASKRIKYNIVGMFRLDVLYVTPININDAPKSNLTNDSLPVPVTIPAFGNYPVSDRMIYGPCEAVKIWATERFSRLDGHVNMMLKKMPGQGMHSERFVSNTLLPAIANITTIRKHPTICFFRARADGTIRFRDCNPPNSAETISEFLLKGNRSLLDVVEDAIGQPCVEKKPRQYSEFIALPCGTKIIS